VSSKSWVPSTSICCICALWFLLWYFKLLPRHYGSGLRNTTMRDSPSAADRWKVVSRLLPTSTSWTLWALPSTNFMASDWPLATTLWENGILLCASSIMTIKSFEKGPWRCSFRHHLDAWRLTSHIFSVISLMSCLSATTLLFIRTARP